MVARLPRMRGAADEVFVVIMAEGKTIGNAQRDTELH